MRNILSFGFICVATSAMCFSLQSCGESNVPTGNVQVFLAAEESIPNGIAAGSGDEDINDGWNLKYNKFLISIGRFRALQSGDGNEMTNTSRYILDLVKLPASGFVLFSFEDVTALRYDKVGYEINNAVEGSLKPAYLSTADYKLMTKNHYSHYVEATLTKEGGRSCQPGKPADCVDRPSLKIRWGLQAGTSFDDCAPESGAAGFAVPAGGTAQVKPTIHGDHWFFTNVTQGVELTERRAQWIADSDLNRDGETTIDELKQVSAASVFPASQYNLSGALIPIATAYDYLEAQARTLGDFQGDGECPTRKVMK